MADKLGKLSGYLSDRSHLALFDIVGGTAVTPRRNLREAGDLFFLAPCRLRRSVVMEERRNRRNGEPQLRRRIYRPHHRKAWLLCSQRIQHPGRSDSPARSEESARKWRAGGVHN